MKLKEIMSEIETASHPVAKALHVCGNFKTMAIGFKKGMILKKHVTHRPAKLFLLQGKVNYIENSVATSLTMYDEINIPVDVIHSAEAIEDSLCILTQG